MKLATLAPIRTLTRAELAEARQWITWSDLADPEGLTDRGVEAIIRDGYPGGVPGFATDALDIARAEDDGMILLEVAA
jgi:hypothetical protein